MFCTCLLFDIWIVSIIIHYLTFLIENVVIVKQQTPTCVPVEFSKMPFALGWTDMFIFADWLFATFNMLYSTLDKIC